MIPSALVRQLESGLADFLRASFGSTTPGFENLVDDLLAEPGSVLKGPYVQLFLPFRAGTQGEWFPRVPLGFTPHRHQERAFARLAAETKRSTLVATGTGSGKTESFLWPILSHCLENAGQPGIKAIVLYPMNALASDQALRIARAIHANDRLRGAVTAGLYVGEDSGGGKSSHKVMGPDHVVTDRGTLRLSPPDILLTNYKMLDYMLIRPRDRQLWKESAGGSLRFLVVDELHAFDGAQGTDLACLIRRLKDRLNVRPGQLCCVGTSATLGGPNAARELRQYATEVFGEPFDDESVVTEERLDIDSFRGDTVLSQLNRPGPEDRDALDPSRHPSPEIYLAAQAKLWLDAPPAGVPSSDEWRVALGDALREHVTLDNVLRRLRGAPRDLDELAANLGGSRAAREDRPLGRAIVLSFLALVSAARRWRTELPEARERRETEGRPRPTEPFLQVRLQLWLRELRRMVATVGARPRLRFSDDLPEELRRAHLPVIHCRECGAMGWATLTERHERGVFHTELGRFYRAFFASDPRVHFLFPLAAFPGADEADRLGRRWRVDPEQLVALEPGEDGEPPPGGVEIVEVTRTHVTSSQRTKLDRDCVFCEAPDSLSLLGFQAATLTSVFIDQLYASRFNEDKKLLAFSDSVQDAAHRAGFFGARTWRWNVRLALARVLREKGELPLSELPGAFVEWWRGPGGLDDVGFVSTFLAPNMLWLSEWKTLLEDGALPEDGTLLDDVKRRLAWEILAELGLQARVGRSLPRTGVAVASVDEKRVAQAATASLEPLRNEVGGLERTTSEQLRAFLEGVLVHLRDRGGILHGELPAEYLESGGENTYVFTKRVYLPDYGPRSRLPAFLTSRSGSRRFVPIRDGWCERWYRVTLAAGKALAGDVGHVFSIVLPRLVAAGVLEARPAKNETLHGLRPDALRVTTQVHHVRCKRCRHEAAVAARVDDMWTGTPCLSALCTGTNELDRGPREDYFGRLLRAGEVQRIFAAEHTGLLGRAEREKLEERFKAPDRERKPWFPNLLSCTPTLEMGIDVGDLSTAILCSVPPAQTNYLQRIGRAGRRDGNALVLAVANARPHDLYFYAEPEEMIAGEISPPGVYLAASAVLARQLTAFAFDRWAASGVPDDALPPRMQTVYANLNVPASGKFPHDFLRFVSERRAQLLTDFLALFRGGVAEAIGDHLRKFLENVEDGDSLERKILEALHQEQKLHAALGKRLKALGDLVNARKKEAVLDEAGKEELDELEKERSAVRRLRSELESRDTLNFFTDEGLVPNYAFPEAPVRLRSVIWTRKAKVQDGERAYETVAYEYDRPAAAALSELAPENDFYAGGRRVTVDRVDLTTAQIERWRFCDACHHAELVSSSGEVDKTCPSCSSALWPDPGQEHSLVRLRQVFAGASDRKSRLADDRDERTPRFYSRQTLVTFRPDDRGEAWQVDSEELPFAFEYLKKATFREINFGETAADGNEVTIAGQHAVRRGFTICKHCGKVQPRGSDPEHVIACPARKKDTPKNFAECVYLYREFSSEAVRILLPLMDVVIDRHLHSFLAAIQVGLRAQFGGRVDHLRTTVTSEPVPDSPVRKQFVVLFDAVPGGTGYLKELVRDPKNLFTVLERARDRLASCRCANDPERDGCYRCLYAYRHGHDVESVSRSTALSLLQRILAEREKVKAVESLGHVSVRGLLDSALEARFLEALRRLGTNERPSTVTKAIVAGKPGYRWTVGKQSWNVEPQRGHAPGSGFGVGVSIDFVFHPARAGGRRPVAVFLDGWAYHRPIVGEDMLKRMSLLASGKYDVWSFTWQDVDDALGNKVEQAPNLLYADAKRLDATFHKLGFAVVPPALRARLEEGSLAFFHAVMGDEVSTADWRRVVCLTLATQVNRLAGAELAAFHEARDEVCPAPVRPMFEPDGKSLLGHRPAAKEPFSLLVHVSEAAVRQALAGTAFDGFRVLACLHDEESRDEAEVRRAWRGFLRLLNFLQPLQDAWFVDRRQEDVDLSGLAAQRAVGSESDDASAWRAIEDDAKPPFHRILKELAATDVPLPEVGLDLPDAGNRTCGAVAELAWPDLEIAVVETAELDRAVRPVDPGWKVFKIEELASVAPLEEALRACREESDT